MATLMLYQYRLFEVLCMNEQPYHKAARSVITACSLLESKGALPQDMDFRGIVTFRRGELYRKALIPVAMTVSTRNMHHTHQLCGQGGGSSFGHRALNLGATGTFNGMFMV